MALEVHHATKGATMPKGGNRGGGRPPKPPGEKRVNVTVKLHPDNYAKLKKLAEEHGLSVGRYIESLITGGP